MELVIIVETRPRALWSGLVPLDTDGGYKQLHRLWVAVALSQEVCDSLGARSSDAPPYREGQEPQGAS